jgi:hypothetical protein
MQKTYSALIIAGLVLLPAFLFAQFNNNTTSPFSRFGLGDLHGYTHGRTAAMGGATLGSRNSQQINFANPASYTSTDSLAFLFEFGLTGKFSDYKNNIGSYTTNDINFRYFSMSFPINRRVSTAIGLTPYSDIGYDIQVNQELENSGPARHIYYGEGSLTRAFLGFGVRPLKNISVGANIFYFFGSLSRNASITFPENLEMYIVQKNDALRLRDFGLNFGIQATLPMENEQLVTIGATLENKPKFTSFNSDISFKSLVIRDPSGNPYGDSDTISFRSEVKGKIQMPLSAGVGLSYVKKNKLEINADYYFQQWSKATFFGEPYHFLTDRSIFAVGGEYIPDKFSIRNYTSRIAYRAGLNYENSYLIIGNQQVSDFGISFGVGLPVYRSNSTINISAELGKRGSTKNNMVRENYMKLNLSVNLYDFWFIKRRFD